MPMSFDPAAPTENHIGEVGGSATKVSATFGPASSTTYTAGQVLMGTTAMAGVARIANGMGYLFGATLGLNVARTAQIDFVVFSPPPGTYTAGATLTLVSADLPKVSKIIHLDDWTAVGAAVSFGQPLDKGRGSSAATTRRPRSLCGSSPWRAARSRSLRRLMAC